MDPACILCDTSTPTNDPDEWLKTGRSTKRLCVEPRGKSHVNATTINSFPDNVLLEIFDFCRTQDPYFYPLWDWHKLAHICPRWRHIIYSSLRRLDLQLLCTLGTPVRKNLGHWPPLPLIVDYYEYRGADNGKRLTPGDEDNLVAALEDSTRKPFPVLTHLCLLSKGESVPALPDEFLGGSAPDLRVAHLEGIPFPALPTLLSSALGLVDLRLQDIPPEGYISPDAMVASLEALTGLRSLFIGFKSPTPPSRTIRLGPITRTGLPSLTTFGFHGVKGYLEDLFTQIDTPRLSHFRISYFNQLDFQVPQLSKFIGRTQNLYQARFKRARVEFGVNDVYVSLHCEREELLESHFSLRISCQGLDWQVSHVAQTLNQSVAMLSNIGDLSIDTRDSPPDEKGDMVNNEWLELLRPFTAVETLHVSGKLAGHVLDGSEGVTKDAVAEMLPALQSLCLEDEPLTSVGRFVEIREFSGRPVTIVHAPGEFFKTQNHLRSWQESPYLQIKNDELVFTYPFLCILQDPMYNPCVSTYSN
ncbi:hypothetical protein EDB89DRAFT_2069000 [Lactarius sanguifluus]|nr:hypothetical protein EDB89DRAFT_2069000 [Lactarius sanguifluus]